MDALWLIVMNWKYVDHIKQFLVNKIGTGKLVCVVHCIKTVSYKVFVQNACKY